jgi:hypothetical protein
MKSHMVRWIFVLGLAVLSAGCFGILGGGGPQSRATVMVRNDISSPTSLTIVIQRAGSDRETLGTLAPGEEKTFTYSSRSLQGNYQLVARQSSGAAVTSREFTLFTDARVHWQVGPNSLSVVEAR